jgi:glycosyltransferase involved in cell wall biosynthesis
MKKPDVVHVYQGPSMLGWPAIVFRAILGVPYVLDVQDLWPESVTSSGMLPIPGAASVLGLWSKLTFRFARKIVVLSEGYRDRLISRGVPSSKIEVVYNWCDERFVQEAEETAVQTPFDLRGRFNVVYAGNFGAVQALKTVLDAASVVEDVRPDIQFVLVGDGIEGPALKEIAAGRRQKNVLFIPRQSPERLHTITTAADVLIIHLKDDPLTRISIPQKTQYALAAGKPVIMAVRGNAADLVREAGAGIICRPESAGDLAHAVLSLAGLPADELRATGNRGREFYGHRLSFSIGFEKILSILESAPQCY